MFQMHSRLSKKILQKFLTIYTLLFLILSLIILLGTGLFFLYDKGKNISSSISTITDLWDTFENEKKDQLYRLLSKDDLGRYFRDYYRDYSVQNSEKINLCLSNFQTSDSDCKYLFMEDENGTVFHSINSSSTEIPAILKNSEEYQNTRKTGNSSITPVKKGVEEGLPGYYSCYIDSQELYGHMLTICFCYDVRAMVRSFLNAENGTDYVQIYNTYGDELYSSAAAEESSGEKISFQEYSESKCTLMGCSFSKNGIFCMNGSYNTLIYTVGTISYSHFLREFCLLFLGVMLLYLIPVLAALLYILPANDKMLQPLSLLQKQIKDFSIESEPVQLFYSDDEIGELSHSFCDMAMNINRQSRELAHKEYEKAITYYKLLTTQLDPHFIYNTMNIINILARQGDCEDIIKVNTALTRVLRERLNTQNTTFEEVGHEIEALKQYQLIMDYRYHNQVNVEYDIDETILDKRIPKNILQPLMENAYYHGLSSDTGMIQGNIEILIYPLDEELIIEINDDGKGFSQKRLAEIRDNLQHATMHKEKEAHIGMENIYRRISYLYKENFSMEIQSEEGHGTTIVLSFPLEMEDSPS